jgi:DNA transformation protein and related proteins
MAHADNEFVDYIIDQMGDPLVVAKKMFGGYGVYRDGVFFGVVDDGVLYLKTNDRTRGWYIVAGMGPFRPNAKQTLKQYYEVPEDALDDSELLREKAKESWQAAGNEKF